MHDSASIGMRGHYSVRHAPKPKCVRCSLPLKAPAVMPPSSAMLTGRENGARLLSLVPRIIPSPSVTSLSHVLNDGPALQLV